MMPLDNNSGRRISARQLRPEFPVEVQTMPPPLIDRALALKFAPSCETTRLTIGSVGEGLPSLATADITGS
jgi:hypothetical protein